MSSYLAFDATVAGALFSEWEAGIGQISDASLKSRSRQQPRATNDRYRLLESAMPRLDQASGRVHRE